MIAEMVIAVSYGDTERDPTIELGKISVDITAILENEIHDIKITVSTFSITPISKAQ